jgi:hypothetical protein
MEQRSCCVLCVYLSEEYEMSSDVWVIVSFLSCVALLILFHVVSHRRRAVAEKKRALVTKTGDVVTENPHHTHRS